MKVENPHAFPVNIYEKGMTLRDWFAGQALAGLCSMADTTGVWQWDTDGVSTKAYEIADALLAQREKKL